MEVENVSHDEQWVQILQRQKVALQAAEKRKGERPRDRKPRGQLVQEFMRSRLSTMMSIQQMDHAIHQSFLPSPYPPSVASLKELTKIYLKDLQLQIHHRGSYVLLRAVTPANVMTAVMAIMEDEIDGAVLLQLYQQEGDKNRPAEKVIQHGDICVVKEPYFKVMNDGGYGLRVDHVNDVVWLFPGDSSIPLAWQSRISELKDAGILKEEGNAALKAGNLYEAVERYSQALQSSTATDETRIIKLNRSLANIRLGCYDQAIEDAGVLTSEYQKSEKGFYRGARSLYELGKFQEAHSALTTLLKAYSNCEAAEQELDRTKSRLKEQESGDYDFKAIYDAVKVTPPTMDLATYIGPVEIRTSEGRGRGLFTTRDVAVGEMLLCEKAFAYCFADKATRSAASRTSLLLNTHTKQCFMGTQADLITTIVRKLRQNPSLIPAYTSLYHGDYEPVKEVQIDGVPIIDTFLVDRIMSLNSFGCPRTSKESHLQTYSQQATQGNSYHTCGVFVHASYINHNCYSNARRSFIGDMQIVRASRDVPKGTELGFWYTVPDDSLAYDKMQDKFKPWGFKCQCVMCEQEKKTKKAVLTKRTALLSDLMLAFEARPGADLPKAERVLAALEKTYSVPAADVPRLTLWDPYLLLTRIYSSDNQPNKVVQTAYKVLESLGFVFKTDNSGDPKSPFQVVQWGLMQDHVVEAWVFLWTAFAKIAPANCDKAEECAKTAYKICVGEDVTFDEKYGKMAREAISEGLDLGQAFQTMKIG